jgi:hypothetical protein
MVSAPGTRTPVFLHIGTRKSGTTYVQATARQSKKELARRGLAVPFGMWEGHFAVLNPEAADADRARGLQRFREGCLEAAGDRILVSYEGLALSDDAFAADVLASLDGFDVQVMITARDLGRQIPSEWQQGVKERLTTSFPDYLEALRTRTGVDAEVFWRRQDVAALIDRWAPGGDPSRVTVLPTPPPSPDPLSWPRAFFGVMGIDATGLTPPQKTINSTLGYPEAEMLRRFNVALGDRLTNRFTGYRLVMREVVNKPVRGSRGRKLLIPETYHSWVREESAAMADRVLASGCVVVGDPQDLLVGELEGGPSELTVPEVSAVATRVLGEIAASDPAVSRVLLDAETTWGADLTQELVGRLRTPADPPADDAALRRESELLDLAVSVIADVAVAHAAELEATDTGDATASVVRRAGSVARRGLGRLRRGLTG